MRGALVLFLFAALPAAAQQDDRSYLTAFLEDNLSSAGRTVTITGFAGALSSQATIESLTIADSEGIWITVNGVVLDWSRSSLLSGQVVVNELSAKEIIVARAPKTDAGALPDPEAAGFSLPDLPVSVEIGRIAAERISLEPALLGQTVEGSLDASLSLIDGEGTAAFDLTRSGEGPEGLIRLDASYSNLNRELSLSLLATEGAGGIAAALLGLPGAPSAELAIEGSGPFEDFGADIRLATDGSERLAGKITLTSEDASSYRFGAELGGDLAPVFLPEYAEFFGPDVALKVQGTRSATGRLDLQQFDVRTRSLSLEGSAKIASDGLPEMLALKGNLAAPDGTPVLLPLGGIPTRVAAATINLDFAQGTDAGWRGSVRLQGLDRADFKVDQLLLTGSGRIGRTAAGNSLGATFQYSATGLLPSDPALATALGSTLEGNLKAHWLEGSGGLSLPLVELTGADYAALARLSVEGIENGFNTTGRVELSAQDFARFSGLVGRPLAGSGRAVIEGSASRLSGFFDIAARLEGEGLKIGVSEVDTLLDGSSRLSATVSRDGTGTTLKSFDMTAKSLSITGSGKLSSTSSDLSGRLDFADLAVLGPGYGGTLSVDARLLGAPGDAKITATGTGQDLRLGQKETDRLLAGQSTLQATLLINDAGVQIETAEIANPQLSVTASGSVNGTNREIKLNARLANLALLVPQFPGPLTVAGTAVQDDAGYQLNLKGTGPGQVDASLSGSVARSFGSADIALSGTAQAALANVFLDPRAISGPVRFDLRLKGALRLTSLSGRVALSGGRLTNPGLGFALERTEAVVDLVGGQALLSATTQLSSGGRIRVDGPVGLGDPYSGDLTVTLERLRLIDPELYETFASGSVRISGPLKGGAVIAGRIDLSETEIRVPSTGIGSATGLPDLRHLNEPGDVYATRVKAGLTGISQAGDGNRTGSGRYGLDLEISAPNKVFIRGRGIDAELGGTVRLGGTTAAIIPSGGLKLIRGRLDILGKRLVLSDADLRLEGGLVPDILISANTESDGIVSVVTIEGPADQPVVRFSAVPDLPEEEVLSRLLFGRGLDTLSALQAAQLANAVAILAGRGGDGIIGRLRKSFGLDDLDVTTSADGSAALRAGKYIADNVYTEIEVGQDGTSRINLNLDVRPGVTLKGRLSADGDTGIGIYVEKDY